jgi:hypothetical protein
MDLWIHYYFIWIHNAIRIENIFNVLHVLNHLRCLGVWEILCFLETYTMFCTYTTSDSFDIFEHKRINHITQSILKRGVIITWNRDIKMQISITDVTIACYLYLLFLGIIKLIWASNDLFHFLNYFVIVGCA